MVWSLSSSVSGLQMNSKYKCSWSAVELWSSRNRIPLLAEIGTTVTYDLWRGMVCWEVWRRVIRRRPKLWRRTSHTGDVASASATKQSCEGNCLQKLLDFQVYAGSFAKRWTDYDSTKLIVSPILASYTPTFLEKSSDKITSIYLDWKGITTLR